MIFARKVWKVLVAIKDGLALMLLLLFFMVLFAALSSRPSPGAVREGLQALIERTAADELVLTAQIFDHAARLKSYALIAQAWGLPRTETAGLGAGA